MTRQSVVEPIPAEGRPLVYRVGRRRCVGTWISLVALPPKHRRGQPPAWLLPETVCGWVQAVDGVALVARLSGLWRQIPLPEGLPHPGTALATEHRDWRPAKQGALW